MVDLKRIAGKIAKDKLLYEAIRQTKIEPMNEAKPAGRKWLAGLLAIVSAIVAFLYQYV